MTAGRGNWLDRLLGRGSRPSPSESGWSFASRPARVRVRPRAGAETQRARGTQPAAMAPPLAAGPPLRYQPGEVIADLYQVQQRVGYGGMGEVWKVRHRQWGVSLAMKEPRPELLAEAEVQQAFSREAEQWINLPLHPNIVTAYYVREIEGRLRIFSEFVAGESLAQRLQRVGRLPVAEALDIAIQCADALAHAHRHGLAHRDIKPSNVLITTDGTAKLVDFGLAKAMEAEEGPAGRAVGARMQSAFTTRGGTPAYMSPEQGERMYGKSVAVGPPSDIWSFGVMLYEMLTGARPDYGPAAVRFMRQDRRWRRRPDRPGRRVMRLLKRCQQPEPASRPAPAQVNEMLRREYRQATRAPYPRPVPKSVPFGPDELNNQALSLLDIGRVEEAEKRWASQMHHFPSLLNRVLYRYRLGGNAETWRGLVPMVEGVPSAEVRAEIERSPYAARKGAAYWNILGAGLFLNGCWGEAVGVFGQALALDPGYWRARWNLAAARLQDGDEVAAQTELTLLNCSGPEWASSGDLLAALRTVGAHRLERLRILEHTGGSFDLFPIVKAPCVVFSLDGQYALSGASDGSLRLWDLASGRRIRDFGGSSDPLLTGARYALPQLFAHPLPIPAEHTDRHYGVHSVALSPDGRYALSGHILGTVRLWDMATGRCLRTFKWHPTSGLPPRDASGRTSGPLTNADISNIHWAQIDWSQVVLRSVTVDSVAFSPDGLHALSELGPRLCMWEVETGRYVCGFEGHTDDVRCAAFSSDGRFALSGSIDKTLRVWEVATGQCVRTFEGHTDSVISVAFSPDARYALSGSQDRTIRLWEVGTGRCVRTFEGHTDSIVSVAFPRDGRYALSGGAHGTLRVWEVDTGRCVHESEGHASSKSGAFARIASCVAFSPDGRHALFAGVDYLDGTLSLWDLQALYEHPPEVELPDYLLCRPRGA